MDTDIKRTDKLYEEFITYMAYRYAIGLAGASSEYAQKRLSAYEIFREMEYDTPEFHQLAEYSDISVIRNAQAIHYIGI